MHRQQNLVLQIQGILTLNVNCWQLSSGVNVSTPLYGNYFVVESDHKQLEMTSLKNLTAMPPRLQRRLLCLQGYDMNIRYRLGRVMILADSLSRLPYQKRNTTIDLDPKLHLVQFSGSKPFQLPTETNADPILSQLRDQILRGWPKTQREVTSQLRPYWSYRDELSIVNGIILKSERVLIRRSMRGEILQKIHKGQQGNKK
ncbi:uncharacterized protein [Palaemon carinicauda]|uniref:uncharacterized protein n=1 Tax=Palaemon carinicauda TaxID=392227 RepID=UPI0035B5C86A